MLVLTIVYSTLATAFVVFVAFKWGQVYEVSRQAAEEESARLPWRCEECGTSALAPNMETMLFVWRIHDDFVECTKKWMVYP